MRCFVYSPMGSGYRLELTERPTPTPGPGEVLVRVRASSLNYRDLVNLKKLAGRTVDGIVPLSDGSGEIAALGPGVSDWRIGDRVAGCFFQKWTTGPFSMKYHQSSLGGPLDGMLASHAVLSADGVVAIPDELSFAEAATLPCAAVTAWHSLVTRGGFKPESTTLVIGTGGVSIFGLQIAKALGGRVIVTSSSDDKLARARKLGADACVNYREKPEWEKEVLHLTEKRGVDHILEVGGPGTLERSLACVAAGGHIALIGVLTGFGAPQTTLFPLMTRNARMDGIYVGARDDFIAMNRLFADKNIRPVIDREFPFLSADEAFSYLESGNHFGKVVLRGA